MNVLRVIFRSKYKKILKERRFEKLSGELYPKILKCMRDDAPYLNADFTISDLGRLIGTNRTYISYTLNRHGADFNTLVRRFRCNRLINLIQEGPQKYDVEEMALLSGFPSARTMCILLKRHHPDVYLMVKAFVKK